MLGLQRNEDLPRWLAKAKGNEVGTVRQLSKVGTNPTRGHLGIGWEGQSRIGKSRPDRIISIPAAIPTLTNQLGTLAGLSNPGLCCHGLVKVEMVGTWTSPVNPRKSQARSCFIFGNLLQAHPSEPPGKPFIGSHHSGTTFPCCVCGANWPESPFSQVRMASGPKGVRCPQNGSKKMEQTGLLRRFVWRKKDTHTHQFWCGDKICASTCFQCNQLKHDTCRLIRSGKDKNYFSFSLQVTLPMDHLPA